MKLRVLLLAGSIAINAGFLLAISGPVGTRGWHQVFFGGTAVDSIHPAPPVHALPATKTAPPSIWSQLATTDLATLVARLRTAGFPPHQILAIIDTVQQRDINARNRQLLRDLGLTADLPYWRPGPFGPSIQKYLDQSNQLGRERFRRLRELLGDDYFAASGVDPATVARQAGSIPRAKLDAIERINADYSDMRAQARTAMQGVTLPDDHEKFALLDREQRADIAGVLTPEQLAEYDLRNSRITPWLTGAMTALDANEAEFRAIYAAAAPFSDRMFPGMVGEGNSDQARAARDEAYEQIKATLGPDRYAEFLRATTSDYQQLIGIVRAQGLSADAAVRTFALRDTVQQESNRIVDDATLTNDQKRDALITLAQNTRGQINGILGPAGAATFLENSTWIGNVESGRAVTFVDGVPRYKRLPNTGSPAPPRN